MNIIFFTNIESMSVINLNSTLTCNIDLIIWILYRPDCKLNYVHKKRDKETINLLLYRLRYLLLTYDS